MNRFTLLFRRQWRATGPIPRWQSLPMINNRHSFHYNGVGNQWIGPFCASFRDSDTGKNCHFSSEDVANNRANTANRSSVILPFPTSIVHYFPVYIFLCSKSVAGRQGYQGRTMDIRGRQGRYKAIGFAEVSGFPNVSTKFENSLFVCDYEPRDSKYFKREKDFGNVFKWWKYLKVYAWTIGSWRGKRCNDLPLDRQIPVKTKTNTNENALVAFG